MVMSWVMDAETINEKETLSTIEKYMKSDIDAWVLIRKRDLESDKEFLSELLRDRFITVIVRKYDNNAIAITFLITTKGKHNVDLLYRSDSYRDLKRVKHEWNIWYIPGDVIEEMKKRARIYLPYAKYEVFVFDTTKKPQRDYIIKLLMYDALRKYVWYKYDDLYRYGLMHFYDARYTFNGYVDKACYNGDAIDCYIRNILYAQRALYDILRSIARKKLMWIRKKIRLHNIVVRMVKPYINQFLITKHLSGFNNRDRAEMYYYRYHSYVEFDHLDKTVKIAVNNDNAIPLLSGYEENEKFVRIKLDLVYYWRLKFRVLGSWIIGVDKLTNQAFSISLPYICASAPLKTCVEYVYGLRDNYLRKQLHDNESVEIIEV